LQDWNARQAAIMAGVDNLRVVPIKNGMTLVDLMGRYLKAQRTAMLAGDLSKTTYGDYLRELPAFVASVGKDAVIAALIPHDLPAVKPLLVIRRWRSVSTPHRSAGRPQNPKVGSIRFFRRHRFCLRDGHGATNGCSKASTRPDSLLRLALTFIVQGISMRSRSVSPCSFICTSWSMALA